MVDTKFRQDFGPDFIADAIWNISTWFPGLPQTLKKKRKMKESDFIGGEFVLVTNSNRVHELEMSLKKSSYALITSSRYGIVSPV